MKEVKLWILSKIVFFSSRHNFRLFWIGKMLINNPWSFEFCLDRDEQRVDNLFENGSLEYLTELDLSAFYQTIDNQTIQSLCYNHLSSNSVTKDHLRKISLNHCYRITDTGVQWMVGSCHSIKIRSVNKMLIFSTLYSFE